jgi:hypothetical protein
MLPCSALLPSLKVREAWEALAVTMSPAGIVKSLVLNPVVWPNPSVTISMTAVNAAPAAIVTSPSSVATACVYVLWEAVSSLFAVARVMISSPLTSIVSTEPWLSVKVIVLLAAAKS